MNKYGPLIERLISIKDSHPELTRSEKDAINEACNALESEGHHEQKQD
ncbi:hypothetical protein [Dehalobacter sp. 14DCB1]|nr:hypothetical protein [Dehalobacter sp. 14DCB1]